MNRLMPLVSCMLLIWLSLCVTTVQAQICTGNVSEPIYAESFGSGANPGPELPEGTTTYRFGSIGGGNYVVTNNSGLNGGLWHAAPDHTPDDNEGYMLLFDASDSPGTFFGTVVDGLCENTNYVFSCFVANIVVPSACGGGSQEPNLRFTIFDPTSGVELGTTTTGAIPTTAEMSWDEYAITFRTSPGQTSIELQVSNNAPGGCGNDLVIDDFSLRICNPRTVQSFDLCEVEGGTVRVGRNTYTVPGTYEDVFTIAGSCNDSTVTTILTGQEVALSPINFRFCAGESVTIGDSTYTVSTAFTDTLMRNSSCPQYQPYVLEVQDTVYAQSFVLCNGDSVQVNGKWYSTAGVYRDSLRSSIGCDSILLITIETAAISVRVDPETAELEVGESVSLNAEVSLAANYELSWLPSTGLSCDDCFRPLATPLVSTTYTLLATDPSTNCQDSTQVTVNVEPCAGVYVPNAFSPNRDGRNDVFTVHAKPCFQRISKFQLFDRWGSLIYSEVNQDFVDTYRAWDGRINGELAHEGVYVYAIILESLDGRQELVTGDVVLIR